MAIVGGVIGGWLVIGLIIGLVMDSSYTDRALPGFTIGSRDISGMTSNEIVPILNQIQDNINLNLSVDGVNKAAKASDLGITVDQKRVLGDVFQAADKNFWVYRPHNTHVDLTLDIDAQAFNTWVVQSFPTAFTSPTNAGLAYDSSSQQFQVSPSAPGTGVDSANLDDIAQKLADNDGQGSFTLTPTERPADITDAQAASARDQANQHLTTQCSFTANGEVVYTLTPDDIAAMATVTPGPDGGLTVGVQATTVDDYLRNTLAAKVDRAAVTEKTIVDDAGATIQTTQTGQNGRTMTDLESLTTAITQCLTSGKGQSIAVTFTEVPYQTESTKSSHPAPPAGAESSHWVDVNLTNQTVTLMDGSTPSTTFSMSSGAPSHPTPTGVYQVYSRVTSQSLSGTADGEYYYYDDVHWATWFYEDFGFHTAYWHDDFGTPVSHGCINLREADARAVFDWLAIGDWVDVHD
ncbi:MAG: L,D-transpeptidase [Propionibacteriaceae bacterium]|nr:L,D-transpeptidase [Propionibacteriaceae bacterium]